MSWEQRNADFCNAQTEAQMAYIEAERTVAKLQDENAKLRDLMYERAHKHAIQHMTEDELRIVATNALDENAKLRELVASVWRLFTEHGAVHPSDLSEVDAVRDRMRELGVEVDDGY